MSILIRTRIISLSIYVNNEIRIKFLCTEPYLQIYALQLRRCFCTLLNKLSTPHRRKFGKPEFVGKIEERDSSSWNEWNVVNCKTVDE